jgi:hypothetical protein
MNNHNYVGSSLLTVDLGIIDLIIESIKNALEGLGTMLAKFMFNPFAIGNKKQPDNLRNLPDIK